MHELRIINVGGKSEETFDIMLTSFANFAAKNWANVDNFQSVEIIEAYSCNNRLKSSIETAGEVVLRGWPI